MPQVEPAVAPSQPALPTLDSVREMVKWRIRTDDAFGDAIFSEAIQVMLTDDMATAKSVLYDYIDATMGFADLSAQSDFTEDMLREMFSPAGDPRGADLFRVLSLLQQHRGIRFEVSTDA